MSAAGRHGAELRILVVEDDAALRLALSDRLAREGYGVDCATDGEEAASRIREARHDLILLDIRLPGPSGIQLAREARSRGIDTPILMLTARGEVADRVSGLEVGADDYLAKPFEFVELLARIRALLRRSTRKRGRPLPETVEKGDLRIDFRSAQVFRNGAQVALSTKEFQLLRCFVENEGVALSREELLDVVWGYDARTHTRTVDMHVARLRQKLEQDSKDAQLIFTVRGLGYRFGESELAGNAGPADSG